MSKPSLSAMIAKLAAAKAAGPKARGIESNPGGTRSDPPPIEAQAAGSTAPPHAVVVATPPAPVARTAGGEATKQANEEELRVRARRLKVRTFVQSMLSPGLSFMNARVAYHAAVNPDASDGTARSEGYSLLQQEDVREEMRRQLRAIDKAADLDDAWVYARWRMIANANLFDYLHIDASGKVTWQVDSRQLTPEQQLVIREVVIDTKTGLVTRIKLANIDQAVLNVAKARQMVDGNRDVGAVDLAQRLTARMESAKKRIPRLARVFDNESGEQIA